MRKQDLLLSLDSRSGRPLYKQIYEQVTLAIKQGRLCEGDRLPSIRRLSHDLGVSHTTVEQAYLQLSTEGYVVNVPRSGYVVERIDTELLNAPKADMAAEVDRVKRDRGTESFFSENAAGAGMRYDFSYANLQPDSFPVKVWNRLVNEVLYTGDSSRYTSYSYTDTPSPLSTELARYLASARGVNCVADQIMYGAGTAGAMSAILSLFSGDERVFGMEEPGYATALQVARNMSFRIAALPTDKGPDAFIDALYEHNPKVVFTTPSHQFPTGSILPLEARMRLLKWAMEHDAYIIEDDSCNEYRYDVAPVPSLQSLDTQGRVIYLGNVSKVLSPALRVAYFVLPPALMERFWRLDNNAHYPVSLLTLEVLARFFADGHWQRHVRKMAVGNRRRHDLLLSCLQSEFGDAVSVQGVDAGMHLYTTFHIDTPQEELARRAKACGVGVYGTKYMWFTRPAPDNSFMMGFSAIADEDIPEGIATLRRAWLG